MSIIAIFSGIYSSADTIAQRLADELGYTLVGDELLEDTAGRFGTTTTKLAKALSGDRGLFDGLTHEWNKALTYVKAALAERLKTDDLIYLGPATLLIPRNIGHVLRVAIVADPIYRVRQAAAVDQLKEAEAQDRIEGGDWGLTQWTQQLFGLSPWDASLFDLKIPLPQKSPDQAVELILTSTTGDALRPTDRSVKAVLDFELACRVNLALLEEGHPYCDVQADGDTVSVVINKKTGGGKLARTVRALRYEQAVDEVREVALALEGVNRVETRPGAGFKRRATTLLVDDEREYVLTLSERLGLRDIESDVVYDGSEALSALEEDEPKVMVLDLRMPGMDGLEVLRRVKRDHPGVEVIIVTGHGNEKDEQMARELGAFDYLKKPVDIKLLAETMQRAMEKAETLAEANDDE